MFVQFKSQLSELEDSSSWGGFFNCFFLLVHNFFFTYRRWFVDSNLLSSISDNSKLDWRRTCRNGHRVFNTRCGIRGVVQNLVERCSYRNVILLLLAPRLKLTLFSFLDVTASLFFLAFWGAIGGIICVFSFLTTWVEEGSVFFIPVLGVLVVSLFFFFFGSGSEASAKPFSHSKSLKTKPSNYLKSFPWCSTLGWSSIKY